MSQKQNNNECHVTCWIVAAVVGVIAMVMLYMMADFGVMQALFTGGLLGVVLGLVLSLFLCRGQNAPLGSETGSGSSAAAATNAASTSQSTASASTDATASATPAAEAAQATSAPASAMTTAAPLMSSDVKPSAPLAGEAELASRKGDWKYEAPTAEKPKAKPKKAAAKAAPKAAAEKPAKAAPKRAAVAADGKPMIYDAPPAEGGDDLKLISGVGPKLEQTLNDMGIYRFEQVAGWRKKEIAWVDDRLRFKGRIERDDWMSQAKILAKGGETEFSKRKKK